MMRQKSFTLMELVIVIAVTGIVAGTIFQILDNGLRAWRIQSSHSEIREDARWGLNRLIREIRQASSVTIPSGNSILFTYDEDRNGIAETFLYDVNGTNLQRTRAGAMSPILSNVVSFNVSGNTPTDRSVTFSLQIQGRENTIHAYQTSAYPRFNQP